MYKLISNKNIWTIIKRNYSSALYITGDKAQNNFAVLTPHIDFETRIEDKIKLKENLKARNVTIDIDKLEKRWNFFKSIDETKQILEFTKTEIANEIKELLKEPEKNSHEIEKLKVQIKLVKDDIKNVKDYLYGLEETAVIMSLELPNVLHKLTPQNGQKNLVHTFLEQPQHKSQCHLDYGVVNNLLECTDANLCFLQNDAALFEIAVSDYFAESIANLNFTLISNPCFVRSIVVEGCGGNFASNEDVFTIQSFEDSNDPELNKLHLVGSASLYSFMAYFTKHKILQNYFPLKYYTIGRKYQPQSDDYSLFNLPQETSLQIFIAALDNDEIIDKEFHEIVTKITKLYENLGYHFKLFYLPANDLKKHESLRLSIQMFSNFLQEYVEVGNLSICDNYPSKRLLFNYSEDKDTKFPKIISGSLFNVNKLLGCVLENNSINKKDLISDILQKYVP